MLSVLAILSTLIFAGYALDECALERDRGYECDKPVSAKFYFDKKMGVCQSLRFRGCGGNANSFESFAICKQRCIDKKGSDTEISSQSSHSKSIIETCDLPSTSVLTTSAQSCKSGCPDGFTCNSSNFCCPTKQYICHLPTESGREILESVHTGRYAFDHRLNNCLRFSYFGSGGNLNNFPTFQMCKEFCS